MRWPLVIVGYRGWLSQDLHDRMKSGELEGWLKYLGFVNDDLLPIFMSGARLFVYPSLYEGFGLPVLEAMSSGIPVICSNAEALKEVAGGAALFHEPEDVDELSNLLALGLQDEVWREKVIKAGFKQSSKFSWDYCAQDTMNVYKVAQNL
jgi:alpha-1,3-rhamnosyl/mannosyltransferase